jgi:hypothetical protein
MDFFLTDNDKVVAFERIRGDSKVVVLINTTSSTQKLTVDFDQSRGELFRFSDGTKTELSGSMDFEFGPWEYEVFSSTEVSTR